MENIPISVRNLSATPDGRNTLNTKFKFCKNLTKPEDQEQFVGKYWNWRAQCSSCRLQMAYFIFCSITEYLTDVYGNLAMVNYPYESSFLAPLPAYPVAAFCANLNESFGGTKLIDVSVRRAIYIYKCNILKNIDFVPGRLCKKRWPSTQITREPSSVWILIRPTIRNWMRMVGTINPAPRWWCRCAAKDPIQRTCFLHPSGISIKFRTNALNDSKCDRTNRWPPQFMGAIVSGMQQPPVQFDSFV